jgi:hypothetical protein
MDLDALRTRMESQETMARISDDARQARRCGVFATPGVFVEGKAVDPLAILEIGFWDKMADHYWQRIAVPRPEAAKLSGIWRSPG